METGRNGSAMQTPALSVVVVTYNSAQDIVRCLRALRASDVPLKVVAVDNHSEDDTVRLLRGASRQWPNLKVISAGKNLGFAKGVNLGLSAINTRYLAILNPDCFVHPATLGQMLAVMEANPRIGLAGCLLLNEDGTEQAGCRRYLPTPWRALMRVIHVHRLLRPGRRFDSFLMSKEPLPTTPIEVEALSGALMIVRREALQAVGTLDERYFMHCEDLDWCVRFRQAHWKVVFIPNAYAVHRKGGSTRSRPLRVEYYKHAGMIRFYRDHLRCRYPGGLMWAVTFAVWARFLVKSVALLPQSISALLRAQHSAEVHDVAEQLKTW